MRALLALGYRVSFAASRDGGGAADVAALAADGIAVCGAPFYSCVEDVLACQAGSFDLVYCIAPPTPTDTCRRPAPTIPRRGSSMPSPTCTICASRARRGSRHGLTPIAAEGLPLPASLRDLIGGEPAELAARILRYHADRAANDAAAADGAAMVAGSLAGQAVRGALEAALLGRHPPIGQSLIA